MGVMVILIIANNGEATTEKQPMLIVKYPGNKVAMSNDGNYFATASHFDLRFFSKDNGTPLWKKEIKDQMYTVSISGKGEKVIAGVGLKYQHNITNYYESNGTQILSIKEYTQ